MTALQHDIAQMPADDPRFDDPDYCLRTQRVPHEGMPPMDTKAPPTSYFEFWPSWRFYTPLFFYGLWLSLRYGGATLPTIVNPHFDNGGVVGESKVGILDLIASGNAKKFVAPYVGIENNDSAAMIYDRAIALMKENNVKFPVVAKPNNGCRGMGVQPIYDASYLMPYIEGYPQDEVFILQELVDYEGEGGVFYVRQPDEEKGKIISLTLKYFPYVIGDGKTSLKELIENDPRAGLLKHVYLPRHEHRWDMVLPEGQAFRIAFTGSHSRGTIFKNGNEFITKAMEERFDEITKEIPEFYFGRIDIRFKSMKDLETGDNMRILEINGATGEVTHVWDSKNTLMNAYKDLAQQYKLLYQIGAKNRKRGFKADSMLSLWKEYKAYKNLIDKYPQTH